MMSDQTLGWAAMTILPIKVERQIANLRDQGKTILIQVLRV
jgi:hypothetical protein